MRIIDLSREIEQLTPGFQSEICRELDADGWNASTLTFYSHCATHMDAPRHFLNQGGTIDQLNPAAMIGPAHVVNLAPVEPRQSISVDDVHKHVGDLPPRSRLLLRTDWYHRYGTPEYRDDLPRVSRELAHWLVEQNVALLGVEPPSVADVNDLAEVTEVHQTLLKAGIIIVEGLCRLDQISSDVIQLIALPLKIVGGDGSPIRAVAVEE